MIERRWSRRAQCILVGRDRRDLGLAIYAAVHAEGTQRTFVEAGLNDVNKDLGSLIGWPHVVHEIADVAWAALPADEQRRDGDPHQQLQRGRAHSSSRAFEELRCRT